MATQLRMYVINRGQLDAFVAAWRAGVYPLREQHGFRMDSSIRKTVESELYFFSRVFGFTPHDAVQPVEIHNL